MSLSPFYSFQSRYVTYLLNRPRILKYYSGRSKAWVYGRSLVGVAGSIPAVGMDICFECCVLSGRGLCDGLITRS